MAFPRALLAVAGLLVIATSVAAQEPDLAPPIEIEDAEIDALVVPLGERVQAGIELRVGCEPHEAPTTETQAILDAPRTPEWLNLVISPSALAWETEPTDCPSMDLPFAETSTLSVSTTQNAPAYEEVRVGLQATVTKEPPGVADTRSYGPQGADLVLTPGYFHQHNVLAEEKIKEASPGQTLTFEGTIHSFSNHETRFDLEVIDPPGSYDVRLDPPALTLAPNETGTWRLAVEPLNHTRTTSDTVAVSVGIEGASTHPLGGENRSSQLSFLAKFQPDIPDPRDASPVPGPGPLAVSLLVVTGAAARARQRDR